MSRPLRVQYPGAVYHITSRGNRKQTIYSSEIDKLLFLANLRYVVRKYKWIVYAYCLMENHYHLLVETPIPNLSSGMRDLNGVYAQLYNQIHKTVGHLFQGRFKSILIERELHLLEVARYTVLNPVRAGLASDPSDWKWSTYSQTIGKERQMDFLAIDELLLYFSQNKIEAVDEYINFVSDGIALRSPFENTLCKNILGSQRFVSEMWELYKHLEKDDEITINERMLSRPTLEDIFDSCKNKNDRNSAIYFAQQRASYSLTEIARYLDINRVTVSRIFNKIFKMLQVTTFYHKTSCAV